MVADKRNDGMQDALLQQEDTTPNEACVNIPTVPTVDHDTGHTNGDGEKNESSQPISVGKIFCLCSSAVLVDWAWAMEDAIIIPLLVQHDVSVSVSSMVYVPIAVCGLVLHPIFGRWSDECTSSLGRRRPFIIGLSAVALLGLLGIAFTDDIASMLPFALKTSVIVTLFVVFFFADLSVDLLMVPARAIIFDITPGAQADQATSILGVFLGVGRLLSLLIGSFPVDHALKFATGLELSHTGALCLVSTVLIFFLVLPTLWVGKETVLVPEDVGRNDGAGLLDAVPGDRCERDDCIGINDDRQQTVEGEAGSQILLTKLRCVPSFVKLLALIQTLCYINCMVVVFFWTQFTVDRMYQGTSIRVAFMSLAIQSFVSIVASAIFPALSRRFGRIPMFYAANASNALLLATNYWDYGDITVTLICSMMGFGFAALDYCAFSILEDQMALHDDVDSDENRGFYSSLVCNSIMVAMLAVPLISLGLLSAFDGDLNLFFAVMGGSVFLLMSFLFWYSWKFNIFKKPKTRIVAVDGVVVAVDGVDHH